LFRRSSAGDPRAREAIIVGFLPYARYLARCYAGRGEPLEDLYQAASIGLIKAVDRYDPGRGDSFVAFATPTIRGEILSHFRNTTWCVHVPRPVQDRARRVAKVEAEIQADSKAQPTAEVIAKRLGLAPAEVADAQGALRSRRAAPLDVSCTADDEQPLALAEVVGDPEPEYERIETRMGLLSALAGLHPRERAAVLLRFGAERTQSEIASRIGVSQMQVSRLLRHATPAVAAALELG
jgi:RNA polymerase sigma-B factor